jgi:hypothetical protein
VECADEIVKSRVNCLVYFWDDEGWVFMVDDQALAAARSQRANKKAFIPPAHRAIGMGLFFESFSPLAKWSYDPFV